MRVKFLSVLFLLSVILTGCYVSKTVAPANSKVALATEFEPMETRIVTHNWYILAGLVPISNNKTDNIIQQNHFTKVRVINKFTGTDYLLSLLCNSIFPTSIITFTTVVEGTTK